MSVTCDDLVEAVRRSNAAANCEADWRGVCARAYYSIYHCGRSFYESLEAAGLPGSLDPEKKGGLHEDLYTRLLRPSVPESDARRSTSRQVGALMSNLHSQRVKADYKPWESMDKVAADNGVAKCRNALALLSGQPTGAPLPKFSGKLSSPSSGHQPGLPTQAANVINPTTPKPVNALKVVK
jgi:hypothetical protein